MVGIIKIILGIASAWLAVQQIYWWQVKEYRFDRWWSWVRYNEGWKEFFGFTLRRPVLTWRSLVLIMCWLIASLIAGSWSWLVTAVVGPALGVAVTAPVNWLGKKILMVRARQRITQVAPKIVGITGSYGKSSSKELLADMLSSQFQVVKTLKNENTEVGIFRRILTAIKPGIEIFVMEVGAYTQGEIARVCEVAPPDIAWVTAIGNQHIDLFGGMENLKKAKFELVQGLKPGGTAVFNASLGSQDLIAWAKGRGIKTVVYNAVGTEANAVGARVVAKLLGVTAKKRLEVEGDIDIRTTPGGIKVWDKSYSINEQGFEQDLKSLKNLSGRKFVVTPGIIELGRHTSEVHRRLAKQLTDLDGVWVTSSWARQLLECKAPVDVAQTLRTGDVILIEGRIPAKLRQMIMQL